MLVVFSPTSFLKHYRKSVKVSLSIIGYIILYCMRSLRNISRKESCIKQFRLNEYKVRITRKNESIAMKERSWDFKAKTTI